MTAWLPAIRLARRRYWLPLSVPTGDGLAAHLLGMSAGSNPSVSLTDCLTRDPAFFFLSLYHWQRVFAKTPIESSAIRLSQLSTFAATSWPQWFRAGDATLGSPEMYDSLHEAWRSLYHETITEPLESWPRLSTRWLELAGPALTTRQLELAVVVDEIDQHAQEESIRYSLPETYGQFQLDLSQMVRVMTRHERLSNRFSEQLEAQKRAAVKQFAYGLSHELNNPLANISVRAQGLQRNETVPEKKQSLARMVEQTSRAHDMLADLMFFAHPPQPVMRDVVVSQVIAEVVESFQTRAAELEIEFQLKSIEQLVVNADPAMMAEALSALVQNAIDAIGVRGRIDIKARQGSNGKRGWLIVQVSDSGPGLSEQAKQHAFDPYFSGREAGRGLGVGLCRAYRIVDLHGGTIRLNSATVGCTATIRLPL